VAGQNELPAALQDEGPDEHRFFMVDVFTRSPLEGNQLAVFTDARRIPADLLQSLAREMNFPETVFVFPAGQGGSVRVRIFTPKVELPFAGHPVLGTAFLVGQLLGANLVRLETGAGVVPISLEGSAGQFTFGRMDQPIPTPRPYDRQQELLAALGVERSVTPVEFYENGPRHVFVHLGSREQVAALRPDMVALAALPPVAANCFAGAGRDWKTRMFAPALGIPEDPATGSGAGPLAVHLVRHGHIAFGDEIEILQGVEIGRPSRLFSRVLGSPDAIERVQVGGCAVVVARGYFRRLP